VEPTDSKLDVKYTPDELDSRLLATRVPALADKPFADNTVELAVNDVFTINPFFTTKTLSVMVHYPLVFDFLLFSYNTTTREPVVITRVLPVEIVNGPARRVLIPATVV